MTEDALRARIARAVSQQPQPTVTVLSSLLAIEDELGWIPQEAIEEVASRQSVTPNDVWAVASFYPNFRFTPPARHSVEICWGPTCHVLGAQPILQGLVSHLGLDGEGDTEDGSISLKYNTCLGVCPHAPAMSFDHELAGRMSLDEAVSRVERIRAADSAGERQA